MSWQFDRTGEFNASGEVENSSRSFDVKFRLVAPEEGMDPGTAWGVAWNQILLRFPTFRDAKILTVSIDGKPETCSQVYEVTGHYETAPAPDDTRATMSFNTKGGREKKIHSFATVGYPGALRTPPDFKHAVGFSNGQFQGVDVVVPQFGFSLNMERRAILMPDAMFAFFHNITGSINQEPFWIFNPGEVLFLGVSGDSYWKEIQGVQVPWYRLSFEFEAMPSIINGTIPPFEGVNKKGMEYFWTFHADRKDEESGITVPVPLAGYVESVYPYADFSWFQSIQWR